MAIDTLSPPTGSSFSLNGKPLLEEARRKRLRRSIPAVVLGVAAMAASFVVFLALEPSSSSARPVLVLDQPVTAGHVITASDLRVQTISAAGLKSISATRESTVIGQAVAADLPAGTLLVAADLASAPGPGPGQAVVAVGLKAGQFPAELAPGAQVSVISAGTSAAGSPLGTGAVLAQGEVYGVHTDASSQLTSISLLLPASEAAAVTQAAAGDAVELVWVSR